MKSTLKTSVCRTIGAVAALAAGLIGGSPVVPVAIASGAMPPAQQNALVEKYCAVCHNDAHLNGGLSLEHFDAARPDPGLAAMLVSKLKGKAMGAAGLPLPDKTTQDALLSALSAESVGAGQWTVDRTQDPATKSPILTASVVEEVPSSKNEGEPDLYRLQLTCHVDTHEAEMQLAWAPGVPGKDAEMSAAVDGKALFTFKVEGSEKMFTGATGTSGTGAAVLYSTRERPGVPTHEMPLPAQTLTIRNVFPDETVVFPFDGLTQKARQTLANCFTASSTRR